MSRAPRRCTIDVADLRRQLGGQRPCVTEVALVDDIRVGDSAIVADSVVAIDLVLESVQGGVDVRGHVSVTWTGVCRRCIEPLQDDLSSEVHELFLEEFVEGDSYPIEHDTIDVVPLVRDALTLDLPLAPLCRADCPGPAPDRFVVNVESDVDEVAEPPRDPRWAALDALREQLDAEDSDL